MLACKLFIVLILIYILFWSLPYPLGKINTVYARFENASPFKVTHKNIFKKFSINNNDIVFYVLFLQIRAHNP